MLWHLVLQKIPDPKTFHRWQPGQPIPDIQPIVLLCLRTVLHKPGGNLGILEAGDSISLHDPFRLSSQIRKEDNLIGNDDTMV